MILVTVSVFNGQRSWSLGHGIFLVHDGCLSLEIIDTVSGMHWLATLLADVT